MLVIESTIKSISGVPGRHLFRDHHPKLSGAWEIGVLCQEIGFGVAGPYYVHVVGVFLRVAKEQGDGYIVHLDFGTKVTHDRIVENAVAARRIIFGLVEVEVFFFGVGPFPALFPRVKFVLHDDGVLVRAPAAQRRHAADLRARWLSKMYGV